MTSLRVGVIGTGFGARVVAPAFAAQPGVDVVGVANPRDEPAVGALIGAGLDLVSIQSPPFLHGRHVAMAAAAGVGVLCDKPLDLDGDGAARSAQLATDAGVLALLNLEFRFHPARVAIRSLVAAGEIGTVRHISWTHLTAGSRVPLRPYGWLFDRAAGGGFLLAWAPHALDLVASLAGPVVDGQAELRTDVPRRLDREGRARDCTAEDGFTATLVCESGATVLFDASFAAPAAVPPRLAVVGDEGVLVDDGDTQVTLLRDGRRDIVYGGEERGDRHAGPMDACAAAVVRAVRTGEPGGVATFADGARIQRVLDLLRGAVAGA